MEAIMSLTKSRKPVDPDAQSDDKSYASHTSCSSLMDETLWSDDPVVAISLEPLPHATPQSPTSNGTRKCDPPGDFNLTESISQLSPPELQAAVDLPRLPATNDASEPAPTTRSVRFDSVEIREYSYVPDQDPTDEWLELAWEADSVSIARVDEHEASRAVRAATSAPFQSNERILSRLKKDTLGEFSRVRLSAVDHGTSETSWIAPPTREFSLLRAPAESYAFDTSVISLPDNSSHSIMEWESPSLVQLPQRRRTVGRFLRRLVGRSKSTHSMSHM